MTDTQSTQAVKTAPVEILYRLRDMNADLLYVGITRDWPTRMTQHQRDKPWWSEVAGVELVRVHGTRPQIEAIERAVIKTEQPTYNKTHNAEVRRLTLPVHFAAPNATPGRLTIEKIEDGTTNLFRYTDSDDGFTMTYWIGQGVHTKYGFGEITGWSWTSPDKIQVRLHDGGQTANVLPIELAEMNPW